MSTKVSVDGKTTWSHRRGSKCGFSLVIGIGVTTFVLLICRLVTLSPDLTAWDFIVLAGPILWILMAFCIWGTNDIIFDDQKQAIYVRKNRFFSKCNSTKMVGQYHAFKECVLQEGTRSNNGGDGSHKVYSINFVFRDGSYYAEDTDGWNKDAKTRIAQEINEWWKTNPFNTESQQLIPDTNCQVVIQQLPIQGATLPVAGPQIVYVQVDQPVGEPPVYQAMVPPQPQPQTQGHMCVSRTT